MKPRVTLEEATTAEGVPFKLVEHDQRLFLECNGKQIDGSHLSNIGESLGKLVTSPFRPARQPKVLFLGLGFGHYLRSALQALPQERAKFYVSLESAELPDWLAARGLGFDDERIEYLPDSPFESLPQEIGPFQAIIADLDYLRTLSPEKWEPTRLRWVRQASDTIKAGGILAFVTDRRDPQLEKNFGLVSCRPVWETMSITEKSKRQRVTYLARKGHYERH